MAADKLNWDPKILGKDLPDVAANKKLTFTEINQLAETIDNHADGIDANAEAVETLETNKEDKSTVEALDARVVTNTSNIAANSASFVALGNQVLLRVRISDIIDNFTSTATDKPASARLAKVLNDRLDAIDSLLLSDESTLDTLQEIVDFIEINKETLDNLTISSIAGLATALGAKLDASIYNAHRDNTSNPHNVTKSQVGLGNVDNTADADKPVSTAQATAIGNRLGKSAGIDAILKKTQSEFDALTPDADTLYIIVG